MCPTKCVVFVDGRRGQAAQRASERAGGRTVESRFASGRAGGLPGAWLGAWVGGRAVVWEGGRDGREFLFRWLSEPPGPVAGAAPEVAATIGAVTGNVGELPQRLPWLPEWPSRLPEPSPPVTGTIAVVTGSAAGVTSRRVTGRAPVVTGCGPSYRRRLPVTGTELLVVRLTNFLYKFRSRTCPRIRLSAGFRV